MKTMPYRIEKNERGVVLACIDCSHTEVVAEFDTHLGSLRTQAARAMLKHARDVHGKQPPTGFDRESGLPS